MRDATRARTSLSTAVAVIALLALAACSRTPSVGLSFAGDALTRSRTLQHRLAGGLTAAEVDAVKRHALHEVRRAFDGLRVAVTDDPAAFWRVEVVSSMARLRSARRLRLPAAGESVAMGPLGGRGVIDFSVVSGQAVQFAPEDASREDIVRALGRGVGRVAVHEFMHQMLGPAGADDHDDENSYEYANADRPSQYWGELHWASARPLLRKRLGELVE